MPFFRLVNTAGVLVTVSVRVAAANGDSAAIGPPSVELQPGYTYDVVSEGEVLHLATAEALMGVASVANSVEYRISPAPLS